MRMPVSLVAARDLHRGDYILVCANENGNRLPEFVEVIDRASLAENNTGIELATGEKWVVRRDAPMIASCKEGKIDG